MVVTVGWVPDKLSRNFVETNPVHELETIGKIKGIICHCVFVAITAGIVCGHCATGLLGIKDGIVNAVATRMDLTAFRENILV